MTIDTTKLREMAQAATPGPWYSKWPEERCAWKDIGHSRYPVAYTGDCFDDAPNAAFIAAANPATVLALLDEVEHSRSVLKSYSKVLVEISESLDIAPFHFTTPVAVERCKRLIAIEAAARNLVKVKGRHHAEIAYQKLVEVLG